MNKKINTNKWIKLLKNSKADDLLEHAAKY